jgi:hypothetical protein
MHSIQFFIRNVPGIDGDNNFPLFYFSTRAEIYNFVSRLVSVPRDYNNSACMVMNNPQHLPDRVRGLHMYQSNIVVDDPDSAGKHMILDGHFNISDNWELLNQHLGNIDNNTNSDFGFRDYLCNEPQ